MRAEAASLLEYSGGQTVNLNTAIVIVMQAASSSGAFGNRAIGPGTGFGHYRIERHRGRL